MLMDDHCGRLALLEEALRQAGHELVAQTDAPEAILMDVARFEQFQSLHRELDETKSKLADRRDVDKAKGLLMQRRSLDENAAYETLRKMAMGRNLKLGDAARSLLAASEFI